MAVYGNGWVRRSLAFSWIREILKMVELRSIRTQLEGTLGQRA
jgi:hypothetical protein